MTKRLKIISRRFNKVYASIDATCKSDSSFECQGEIIKNNFPDELLSLINDFHDAIDKFSFVVLEQIEREILLYDLIVDKNEMRIYHLKLEDNKISFYTKFPSANGFLDQYPGSLS